MDGGGHVVVVVLSVEDMLLDQEREHAFFFFFFFFVSSSNVDGVRLALTLSPQDRQVLGSQRKESKRAQQGLH